MAANRSPVRPKRSLGQNFLRDDNIARKIAAAVSPGPTDVLVEIGPGQGALTKHMIGRAGRMILVEIDRRVLESLREMTAGFPAEIRNEDILTTDFTALAGRAGSPLRIVGNIPYMITSPILFRLIEHRLSVRDATIMMQREVARRITAPHGSKEYGILSVLTRLYADASSLFDVSPHAFFPKPRVTSTVLRLTMLRSARYDVTDEAYFRAMVRGVFGKRRKTLRNSLDYFLGGRTPRASLPVDLQRRPEDLALPELVDLANALVREFGPHLPEEFAR
jgi:16S rRNA (adenine1518-N6/adenine1519-N6)-dimethyltransferase